jgi:hypothetical protein
VQRVQQKYDRHGLNEENGIIVDLVYWSVLPARLLNGKPSP